MSTEIDAVERPGVWYPPGAGGMWLNYLVWCSRSNEIIEGNHTHFEFNYLESLNPDYLSFLGFYTHHQEHEAASIKLGSERAWFNFFLNVQAKKAMPNEYDSLLNGAKLFLQWRQETVEFNLDWCLIFEDPEQFVAQLNSITDLNVQYNSVTEQAFAQYRNSCIAMPDVSAPMVQAWRQAILDLFTNRSDAVPQRLQTAEQIFYNTYYRI